MTTKTTTEAPVRVAAILAHGGVSRTDVARFAVALDWEGEEIIDADAARALYRRSEIVNAHTSRVRYAWLAHDRQAELAAAFLRGVAGVDVSRLHGTEAYIRQEQAGTRAKAEYARAEPEVGSPGGDANEFAWFARKFPDEERKYRAEIDANDREIAQLLRGRS